MKLQCKQTKAAKRLLKHLSGRERRFATDTNHVISKRIVAKARTHNAAIGLEDLQGIRTRARAPRAQRATLHGWSFNQLRSFLEYKGVLVGVPVRLVDPRNTSRTCPAC